MFQIRRLFTAPLVWGLVAIALGSAIQMRHVAEIGSLEGTLRVGADTEARSFIEDDLGDDIPLAAGEGHDGWQFFVTARDPFARNTDRLGAYEGYRFRRLLGPLIAGGGGTFSAGATLVGLNVVGILGFALAVGSVCALATQFGAPWWTPVAALLSPGLWLSIQLVTADGLALGLALLSVYLAVRRRPGLSILAMSCALFAKETSVLFAAGLATWLYFEDRRIEGALTLVIPVASFGVWLTYIQTTIGDALQSRGNIRAPFVGIAQSIDSWTNANDITYWWLAIGSVVLAAIGVWATQNRLVTALGVPWVLVAITSSAVVWDNGNNALRVLAPCWVLGVLGLAMRVQAQATHG